MIRYILLLCGILFFNCQGQHIPQIILLSDLVDTNQIEKIIMYNNKGKHELTKQQKTIFLQQLNELNLVQGISLKMGNISAVCIMNGQKYLLEGRTGGNYIQLPFELISRNKSWINDTQELYFQTNGFNFDKL